MATYSSDAYETDMADEQISISEGQKLTPNEIDQAFSHSIMSNTDQRTVTRADILNAAYGLGKDSTRVVLSRKLHGVVIDRSSRSQSSVEDDTSLSLHSTGELFSRYLKRHKAGWTVGSDCNTSSYIALRNKKYNKKSDSLWSEPLCSCRKSDDGKALVKCSNEECLFGWHHCRCVGVKKPSEAEGWYCPSCTELRRPPRPWLETGLSRQTIEELFTAQPVSYNPYGLLDTFASKPTASTACVLEVPGDQSRN